MKNSIEIEINGEAHKVAEGTRLSELVADLALSPERVAIELNREVIRRQTWAERMLSSGDKIEIVHFVGGG